MISFLKFSLVISAALLLQVTILPAWLTDPFQPNLLIVLIVYLGLRGGGRGDLIIALLLGLIHDCFSGIYLGLSGFSFLILFFLLKSIADRLYTDTLQLIILVVFLATLGTGFLHLFLLMIFSAANGIYTSLLPGLLPQALVNALAASLMFGCSLFSFLEKGR